MSTIPYKVYRSLHFCIVSFVFILFGCNHPEVNEKIDKALSASADIKSQPPVQMPDVKGASGSWWQHAQKDIEAREYYISWQQDKKVFQSPNRKNNLRAMYKADDFRLQLRES